MQTRPDIIFDVCELSMAMNRPKIEDIIHANKTLVKVQSEKVHVKFPSMKLENLFIECFSDASFANLLDDASQGGYVS